MPDNVWTCIACRKGNPPYTEVCRECRAEAAPSKLQRATYSSPQSSAGKTNTAEKPNIGTDWIGDHPTLAVIGFLCLPAFFILNFVSVAPLASPGFVLMLFLAGVHPIVSVVRGFSSIFGKRFFGLSANQRFRALQLVAVLLLPTVGIVAFVAVFITELSFQLKCSGGACAQGGMAAMVYMPVAWVSYFVVSSLSEFFVRRGWWPDTIRPHFVPLVPP
jgi:hypothetical protein